MLLPPRELTLFSKLNLSLRFFANQHLEVLPHKFATREEFAALPAEEHLKVRDALYANLDLIESFADENPFHLPNEELDIVRCWRHRVQGTFYVFRELKKYTVFLSAEKPLVAYGVIALSRPFEDFTGPHLPVMTKTVLLPFHDKIVYDGLMSHHNISFGPGIRRMLNQSYRDAKARYGIVTSLPMSQEPLPPKSPKPKTAPRPPSKAEKDEVLRVIIGLTDQFCQEHLNQDYAVLCRKLAAKLGRKRPSPLLRGKPNAWASGIIRAIGGVNFLHDKSQIPYMHSTDIDHYLGTSPSSGAAKLAEIRKMFGMHQFDPNWCLPRLLEENPLVWFLNVDGLIVDIRQEPREVQEIAFEKGLIPYIPADRQPGG